MHTPTHTRVQPGEVDFLREVLESAWPDLTPTGPVAYAPPDDPPGDDPPGDDPPGDDPPGDDPPGDDPPDAAAVARAEAAEAEAAALKRRLKDSEKARKAAEKEAATKKEGERVEAGQWEELANERGEEIKEKDAEIADLKGKIKDGAFGRSVTSIASTLNYHNPAMVAGMEQVRRLRDTAVDDDGDVDDAMVERELKKLAKAEPYLVKEQKPQNPEVKGDRVVRNGGGNGGDGEYTFDPRGKMDRGRRPVSTGGGD